MGKYLVVHDQCYCCSLSHPCDLAASTCLWGRIVKTNQMFEYTCKPLPSLDSKQCAKWGAYYQETAVFCTIPSCYLLLTRCAAANGVYNHVCGVLPVISVPQQRLSLMDSNWQSPCNFGGIHQTALQCVGRQFTNWVTSSSWFSNGQCKP